MSQSVLVLQEKLPRSIPLVRYNPDRSQFNWNSWDPCSVKTSNDLPPYLILGGLDEDSFNFSGSGWSAKWRGIEPDTYLEIKFSSGENRYEIHQIWSGVEGGFTTYPSRIPLNQLIPQTLYLEFPGSWDAQSKEDLESRYQLTYIEQPKGSANFCGIPDGAFKAIAFPVSVKNLRRAKNWIQSVLSQNDNDYPVSVEAKLLLQVVNYLEGKAPAETTDPTGVFFQSLDYSGLSAYSFPVRETANDGSSAWTLRRDIYVLFVSVPFAGLTDLLEKLCSPSGSIRLREDPELPIELQPFVLPAGLEIQVQHLAYWDANHSTRCFWQLQQDGHPVNVPQVEELIKAESKAEELLEQAQAVSDRVMEVFDQILSQPKNH